MVVKDFAEFGHDPFELAKALARGRGLWNPCPFESAVMKARKRAPQLAALILFCVDPRHIDPCSIDLHRIALHRIDR
jgi:hypothetical protein